MKGGYIRVVAPATLEEDFTFDVLLDGKPFTVVVPKGGVREGEEFEVPYPMDDDIESRMSGRDYDDDSEDNNKDKDLHLPPTTSSSGDEDDTKSTDENDRLGAPYGRFRVALCSCCDVITQATFWMALCCFPVLLAQVLTRLRLKWNGTILSMPEDEDEEEEDEHDKLEREEEMAMTFNKIVLTFVGVLLLGHLPVVGSVIVFLFYLVMSIWIGGNLRRVARQRYKIPTRCSMCAKSGAEDRCVMGLCGCCALIQIARHTHNDKEYPGYCCTTTGLELGAPQIEPVYYIRPPTQDENKKE